MTWIVERAPRDEDSDPLLALVTGRIPGRDDMARMIAVLKARDIPHHVVRKPPMCDFMVGLHDKKPFELRVDGPVFAYGSTTLGLVSARMGWKPGFVDGPPMDECDAHWGIHMLNHGSRIDVIGTMPVPEEPMFIRPVDDGKSFAGKVETPESFEEWRRGVIDVKGWTNLPPTTRVVVAKPREIHAEWRVTIVEGRPVSSSIYREGSRLITREGAPAEVLAFATMRADEWNPRPAYAMDVAATDDGLRIVETNSVSSAGLYAQDMEAYVDAIQSSSLLSGARP